MDKSKIEWTDATWNPLTGCDKVSPGCARCYAEILSARLQRMGQRNYKNGFSLTLHPHMLEQPLRWQRPRTIFVNSMSDLFHADVPLEYIQRVFQVMVDTPRHRYQVLTKRAERLAELAPKLPWPSNVWMGVSVENRRFAHRIDSLRAVPSAVRFLSCEPLLQCNAASVAFFFKQWGGVNKKKAGRLLDGRTWDGMPEQPKGVTLSSKPSSDATSQSAF